ncbi:hypothetical protein CONLIGDRAFT_366503 [Coniochaeta ligniaria NRRL 30616]|uniref:Uncharacterized protein n=1 Tax=Coniochaeta ligniaria NRRL 30616 TaxID=1408157 RepID=A0A1J7IRU9_9PEZI|nr:hypothetical protein CONLIGDRAFT_366503 [Coniochaeta ligniaria NRRL 30616]
MLELRRKARLSSLSVCCFPSPSFLLFKFAIVTFGFESNPCVESLQRSHNEYLEKGNSTNKTTTSFLAQETLFPTFISLDPRPSRAIEVNSLIVSSLQACDRGILKETLRDHVGSKNRSLRPVVLSYRPFTTQIVNRLFPVSARHKTNRRSLPLTPPTPFRHPSSSTTAAGVRQTADL